MEASNPLPSLPPPSIISTETVTKAVSALLQWIKSKAKNQKAQLLDHDELLYLVMTLKKIPPTPRTNPYKIPLPHPILHCPSLESCLIIDDRPKSSLTSDAAKKKIQSESIPISKVLKLSKLRSDYRPFEAKRQLCSSYDIFFADKRVIPLLPKLLGKHFFKKKKIPIPIDLKHKNWKEQIQHSCSSTLLYLRTGTCSILKVGLASQEKDEIVENVGAAINGAVELVNKKWGNIRSFHLKSLDSVALPLYQAVPDTGLKIQGFKKEEDVKSGVKTEGKEKEKSGKKKVSKKGRIHEVRYMDNNNLEELMAKMVDDDGEANEADELGVVETKEKKKKKKTEMGELPKKSANAIDDEADELGGIQSAEKRKVTKKKKKASMGEVLLPEKVANIGEDEYGAIETNEIETAEKKKKKMKKKKTATCEPLEKPAPIFYDDVQTNEAEQKKIAKKKTLTGELLKKTKLIKKGPVELTNGLSVGDGMSDKKKKRIKAIEAEGKEMKIKKKESKRRREAE